MTSSRFPTLKKSLMGMIYYFVYHVSASYFYNNHKLLPECASDG